MDNGDYDFIIIGSGAGGGTLAYRLAPSGKKILLIERGPYVRREKDNWNSRAVNAEGKYNTKELWRNADGTELHPHTNYYVGGNTKFYGAALFRLRERDFSEIKHYGGTHQPGRFCFAHSSRDHAIPYNWRCSVRCPQRILRIPDSAEDSGRYKA